jgi:hypothetical protein
MQNTQHSQYPYPQSGSPTNLGGGYTPNANTYQPPGPTQYPPYTQYHTYFQSPQPMSNPTFHQEYQQSSSIPQTLLNRQMTDYTSGVIPSAPPQYDMSGLPPSASLQPQIQPFNYEQFHRHPMPQIQPIYIQLPPPAAPTANVAAAVQVRAPEFVAVPTATQERTNRLINKINRIAAPHLPITLRPTLTPEAANETYESLKGEWRTNQNLYPPTYARSINSAILEADHIVNNAQTKRSRVRTFIIALLVLGGLALAAAVFKERLHIDPKKMAIVKSICKIVAAFKLIQLGCSGISRANEVAAARTQVHIQRAVNNRDLVVGN